MLTMLFKLGIFEIDFTAVMSFLVGIVLGAIAICMLYALFVIASLRNKKFLIKTDNDDLTTTEVKQMILECQATFKDTALRGELSRVAHCKNLCFSLAYGIATRFYPKSKYPLLELSIDEAMMLTLYIENRIDEILNRKGIRLLKKLKISSIFEFTQKTNKIVDSKAFKITKEVNTTLNAFKKVINVVNPAWWFRKIVIDNTINVITNKMCLVVIAIVGEETYKIYSKTVFNKDVDFESNVDQILSSINDDISNANEETDVEAENNITVTDKNEYTKRKFKTRGYYIKSNFEYSSIYNKQIPFVKKIENYVVEDGE